MTTFGTNDALTQKKWSSLLGYDVIYRTDLAPMIGTDENSIIHLKTELTKGKGDQITYPLMKKLMGEGFSEGQIAEGNGEDLSLYSDAISINELGHVVRIPNNGRAIDSQRVAVPLRQAARNGLASWNQERMSVTFFNHVCGYTPETDPKYTGNNAITAPTRQLWQGGKANDESLVPADVFTLDLVDKAVEMAKTAASPVRPINVRGDIKNGGQDISGGRYVMYLSSYQVTDLRTNVSTGQWMDIRKAAMQGGQISKNDIYTDALGEHNNVILKEANHIRSGVDSSNPLTPVANTARAVLLGAQSCALGYGQDSSQKTYNWNEELFDHKRRMEVSTFTIWGMKKCVFDNNDFSVVTVSTYAAPHN